MCGLMGFYPKKGKKCDVVKMAALAALNEIRGTDSCGISCGPSRLVGTKDQSTARYFIANNIKDIKKMVTVNKPLIFHTRKSTYGHHTEDNAHPFYWEITGKPKDYFVFAHNGTLENYYDLIKTYQLERNRSLIGIDSHVLGLAMFDSVRGTLKEEDVLTEYKGAAAFICYNANVFKVWRGAAGEIEERPMFMLETEDGWYFHSQNFALWSVFGKLGESLENNELITFSNYALESRVKYKRELKKPQAVVRNFSEYRTAAITNSDVSETSILKDLINIDDIFQRKTKTPAKSYDVDDYFKKIVLNLNKNSKNYMKYVWDDYPDVTAMGEINFELHIKHLKSSITNVVATSGSKRPFLFSNGVCVKSIHSYQKLKENFNVFCNSKSFSNEVDFDRFVWLNKELIQKTLVDFIVLEYSDKYTDEVIVLYKDETIKDKGFDFICSNDSSSVYIKNIFDEVLIITGNKYNETLTMSISNYA